MEKILERDWREVKSLFRLGLFPFHFWLLPRQTRSLIKPEISSSGKYQRRGRRHTMDDYISNDDDREWGGAEPSCLFGFDLNVPLTSNGENTYEIRA
ncbi:unnamed protein product [Linum trigynum]|uniref:Uncharacterized protein n=1 Tax=Linum trigynum TaxID=586398 RepID=A0AAV2GD56_9ROSI